MTKTSKRAIRIHHLRRMKRKALKLELQGSSPSEKLDWGRECLQRKKDWAVRKANNLAHCSCHMCGNPRRFYRGKAKLPIRELRLLQQDS